MSAQQILHRCLPVDESTTLTVRALTAFFTGRGLALPDDEAQQRAAARRQRYLDAIPAPLRPAVIAFDRAQLDERDRDRRAGRRQLSDITLETRLRILRDLAKHLMTARHITGWAEVTTGDLEVYLARTPSSRHQQTYTLRRFFGWAKRRKLILTNPTQRLRLGSQPGFTGTILGIAKQRTLFRRWASDAVHPHERLIGLLALLHAASNAEIRTLTVTNVDPSRQAVRLSGRPFPTARPGDMGRARRLPAPPGRTAHPQPAPPRHRRDPDPRHARRQHIPDPSTRLQRDHTVGLPADPTRPARRRPRSQAHRRRTRHARHRPSALPRRQRRPRSNQANYPLNPRTGASQHLAHLAANLCGLEKQGTAATYKHGFGYHPMLAWLDNTGEALAGMLRPGNATANDAADHATVIEDALAQIPHGHRHGTPILVRADSAGGTRGFLRYLRSLREERGLDVSFSIGFRVTNTVSDAIRLLPETAWTVVIDTDGTPRPTDDTGLPVAQIAELTGMLGDPVGNGWPTGCGSCAAGTAEPRRADHAAGSPRRLALPSRSDRHARRSARLAGSPAPGPRPSRGQD